MNSISAPLKGVYKGVSYTPGVAQGRDSSKSWKGEARVSVTNRRDMLGAAKDAGNRAPVDTLGDIFPYLTDMIVDNDDVCVETIIDSLYEYGALHGNNLQTKVEQSPFYTKHYNKLTVKQQQLLRNGKKSPPPSDDDESSDDGQKKLTAPTGGKVGRGKYIRKKLSSKDSTPGPVVTSGGRSFIGVTSLSFHPAGPTGLIRKNGNFEASVQVGSRKVVVGQYPTLEEAAQAHDRALIRVNGPTSCNQPGVLNYPLACYASDSLSKFSAFDPVLKKQLFGSGWTGPKPCDFGFLITQSGALKRGVESFCMDGSQRKKRHKGQYPSEVEVDSEPDEEEDGSDASDYAPSGSQWRKQVYGSHHVKKDRPRFSTSSSSRGQVDDAEDLYFTAEPRYHKPTKPAPMRKADDPNAAKVGEVLMIMHGERERRAGRPPYERGILLDRTTFGGWMVLGMQTDHAIKHLRGEQVSLMGTCDVQMKFMRVPPEAVTAEDTVLREHFARAGKLNVGKAALAMMTAPSNSGVSAEASGVGGAPATGASTSVGAGSAVTTVAALAAAPCSSSPAVPAAWLALLARYPEQTRTVAASAYREHYSGAAVFAGLRKGLSAAATDATDGIPDPKTLYQLADYGNVSQVAELKKANTADASGPIASTVEAGEKDGEGQTEHSPDRSTADQESVVSGSTGGAQRKPRPQRFPAIQSSAAASNRPLNFQEYTTSTFGHKMTDILAASCFALPQEVALLRTLLQRAKKVGDGSQSTDPVQGASSEGPAVADTAFSAPQDTESSNGAQPRSLDAAAVEQPVWLHSVLYPGSPAVPPVLAELRGMLATLLVGNSGASLALMPPLFATGSTEADTEAGSAVPAPAPATQDGDVAASSSSSSTGDTLVSVPSLAVKLLGDYKFHGVNEVVFGTSGSGEAVKRYTFDLPAANRMLMTDLGISPAVVAAGLQAPSLALLHHLGGGAATADPQGVVVVGYFSSPLEAAMVREQVLGLTRTVFQMQSSYLVEATGNFSAAEWAELRRVCKFLTKIHRKLCMP